jgi:rhamnogalacturonyl hydrolase YesR
MYGLAIRRATNNNPFFPKIHRHFAGTFSMRCLSAVLAMCAAGMSVARGLRVATSEALFQLGVQQAMAQPNTTMFWLWAYGPAIQLDAIYEGARSFPSANYTGFASAILDAYLQPGQYGSMILTNQTLPFTGTIGDVVGLFPTAYLDRALLRSGAGGINWSAPSDDALLAQRVADQYVLPWPDRLVDGTISRDEGWTGAPDYNHSFVWSDDAFMGTTLLNRLAIAGAPNKLAYVNFAAAMQITAAAHLLDVGQYPGLSTNSSLWFHGYDSGPNGAKGFPSCCYWSRANGWALMSSVETLLAIDAAFPSHPMRPAVLSAFQRHAEGMARVQAPDGRWYQVLNDSSTFLETSTTAMAAWAFFKAVDAAYLPAATFLPVAQRALAALSSQVLPNGTVAGICEGTGIMTSVADYQARSTDYAYSQPGLGSVFRALAAAPQ